MTLSLLIVDDEPLAVDYLAESLREESALKLDIHKAYASKAALTMLEERSFDILLSDIRMPGLSGIELADRVRELRPRCKIIFLTGYSDFEYVQSALRRGGVDYVLKTEGDEAIVRALEKAVGEIEAEASDAHILQKARQQYRLALPSLRRNYLIDLLLGGKDEQNARDAMFHKLEIGLDPNEPVLAALVRIDEWGAFAAPADRTLLLYSVQNVAEESFGDSVRFVAFSYDRSRMVWLAQAREERPENEAVREFAAGAERIQTSCRQLLKVPVSIALSERLTSWEELGARIEGLKLRLAFRMGPGREMIVTEPAESESPEARRSSRSLLETGRLRCTAHKLDVLESYLDDGMTDEFAKLYDEWFAIDEPLEMEGESRWIGLELFSHLSAFFLTYLNKRELFDELEPSVRTEMLASADAHTGLREMIAYFRELGVEVAEHNARNHAERTHDLIGRVHHYIHQFLHEDLSLTRLANLVYLSPPYFSRMYKQITGQGLLDYINETRINKAKLLLKTTNRKVHEIAVDVGLESAPYFTRLFRKKTGMTPQEYRDTSKGMETL